jgi:hypothetical protein
VPVPTTHWLPLGVAVVDGGELGVGVAVAVLGMLVGGTDVLVGTTVGVLVGATDVLVGTTVGVLVGATDVLVGTTVGVLVGVTDVLGRSKLAINPWATLLVSI